MPRPTKLESKMQEVLFTFILVPAFFIVGIEIVSDMISQRIGGEVFRWFLFGGGTLAALYFYFKSRLKEIRW